MSTMQFESLYPADSWEEQIKTLISFVDKGQSAQMIGLPGVGKYMIFGLLAYNREVRLKHLGEKQKHYQFISVDFSEIRHRPLGDVMKMLFLALADSLRDRKMSEEYEIVNKLLRNAISMNDELVLTEELKHAIEVLSQEKKIKIVYLLDRFEEYIPSVSAQFFANLRILRNRAKYHFSVIFSLNKPLEDLVGPLVMEDFYDLMVGNVLSLPLFDKPTVDFRLTHLEKITGKKVPADMVKRLLELTAGHGKLMRMSNEAYLAEDDIPKDLETFLLTKKPVINALSEIWLSLSPYEQQYLLEPTIDSATKPKAKEYLQQVHLLKDDSIEIPLFGSFIKEQISKNKPEGLKIVYDENANTITKGQLILSDDLTSSEFLLLRFLVVNPERIVERDELINIVWGENKTTAGVTDQALDQLIFRVRRKIEDNPNAPQHLLTVKGRGFRFVS